MARRRRPPRPGALTELPPLKILMQIVILQTIHYVCGTAMILFAALVAGKDFSADLVLHWKSLRGDTTVGWMLGLCWLADSFVGYVICFFLELFSRGAVCCCLNDRLEMEVSHFQVRKKVANKSPPPIQGPSPPAPHLALETRPRLRHHPARHPPARRVPLLALHSCECPVVGSAVRQRGVYDRLGRVELQVERASPNQLWWFRHRRF
jgi:hypothetical protein